MQRSGSLNNTFIDVTDGINNSRRLVVTMVSYTLNKYCCSLWESKCSDRRPIKTTISPLCTENFRLIQVNTEERFSKFAMAINLHREYELFQRNDFFPGLFFPKPRLSPACFFFIVPTDCEPKPGYGFSRQCTQLISVETEEIREIIKLRNKIKRKVVCFIGALSRALHKYPLVAYSVMLT